MRSRKIACPAGPLLHWCAAAVLLAAGGCAQVDYDRARSPLSCVETRHYDTRGLASWYGSFHHGKRTASGQPFDMNGLTAAHRRLPFGTRIRVTNERNGRSVVLTVNDRGPFVRGRLLDVSRRAARELDFIEAGVVPVRIVTVAAC